MENVVKINEASGIPLLGCIAFGIIDRGTNILQVRCTSICNANCQFCSTDGGPNSRFHKTNYIVDVNYLIKELKKVAKVKGDNLIIFLDSVGEPTTNPDFIKLAEAFSLKGIRVTDPKNIGNAIKKSINDKHTTVVEIKVDSDENILPMMKSGTALDKIFGPCVPDNYFKEE